MGLPIFELPESLEIKEGEEISINLDNGEITNNTTNKTYKFIPIPDFMQELIAAGGLINFAKVEMSKEQSKNEKL
jgi:3-isopropylmalate/(R)-2-methylmalate dehydratase small subunit